MDGGGSSYRQRDRSRSPRRDRPRSPRQNYRRSHSPRSRSRSRDREDYRRSHRSRSPMSGGGGNQSNYSSGQYGGGRNSGPPRSYEDRSAAKEAMMQSVRDSSQQDRRVYVGNLSYDVKWHHLKDFMRQGMFYIEKARSRKRIFCPSCPVVNAERNSLFLVFATGQMGMCERSKTGSALANPILSQPAKFFLPMYSCYRMECRRWAK